MGNQDKPKKKTKNSENASSRHFIESFEKPEHTSAINHCRQNSFQAGAKKEPSNSKKTRGFQQACEFDLSWRQVTRCCDDLHAKQSAQFEL